MPLLYTIDAEKNLVHVQVSGTPTNEELLELQRAIQSDPAYHGGIMILADVREADVRQLDGTSMRMLAERSKLVEGRRAIVVTEAVAYGLARMLGSYGEARGQHSKVFTSLEAARNWLGVD